MENIRKIHGIGRLYGFVAGRVARLWGKAVGLVMGHVPGPVAGRAVGRITVLQDLSEQQFGFTHLELLEQTFPVKKSTCYRG